MEQKRAVVTQSTHPHFGFCCLLSKSVEAVFEVINGGQTLRLDFKEKKCNFFS